MNTLITFHPGIAVDMQPFSRNPKVVDANGRFLKPCSFIDEDKISLFLPENLSVIFSLFNDRLTLATLRLTNWQMKGHAQVQQFVTGQERPFIDIAQFKHGILNSVNNFFYRTAGHETEPSFNNKVGTLYRFHGPVEDYSEALGLEPYICRTLEEKSKFPNVSLLSR